MDSNGSNLHRTSRRIRLVWADSVYNGKLAAWAASMKMTLQIDYEVLPASHEAMILWAMTALMARRLAQPAQLSNAH